MLPLLNHLQIKEQTERQRFSPLFVQPLFKSITRTNYLCLLIVQGVQGVQLNCADQKNSLSNHTA